VTSMCVHARLCVSANMSGNCSYLTLIGKVQVELSPWMPTPSPVRRGTNPLQDTSKIAAE